MKIIHQLRFVVAACLVALGTNSIAQVEVKPVANGGDVVDTASSGDAKLDLGETQTPSSARPQPSELSAVAASMSASNIGTPPPPGTRGSVQSASKKGATKAAQKPKHLAALQDSSESDANGGKGDSWVQRIQFDRLPIRVSLPIANERLVTFPNPVALHVPTGSESSIWTQVMDRTAYVRALEAIDGARVVAEDLVTGQMIPLDLFADGKSSGGSRELQIFYKNQGGDKDAPAADKDEPEDQAMDMVALTRYAAQTMYAPKRLVPSAPGVYNVPLEPTPISGFIRGQRVGAAPMGQWRSGALFVTAVRVTNLERQPLDLDLDQLRGSWIAATPQHRHLLAAGTDWDWTTVYLVCAGSFETCK